MKKERPDPEKYFDVQAEETFEECAMGCQMVTEDHRALRRRGHRFAVHVDEEPVDEERLDRLLDTARAWH